MDNDERALRCAQCGQRTDPDGRHLVNGSHACPREHPDAPLVTLDAALELGGWSPADLLGLVHTAGELWLSTGRADPDDVLNGYQRSLLERAAASHRAETDGYGQPETWVQYYDPDTGVPLPGPPDTLREMRDPS